MHETGKLRRGVPSLPTVFFFPQSSPLYRRRIKNVKFDPKTEFRTDIPRTLRQLPERNSDTVITKINKKNVVQHIKIVSY